MKDEKFAGSAQVEGTPPVSLFGRNSIGLSFTLSQLCQNHLLESARIGKIDRLDAG